MGLRTGGTSLEAWAFHDEKPAVPDCVYGNFIKFIKAVHGVREGPCHLSKEGKHG